MISIVRELVEIYFQKKVSRTAAQLAYYLLLTLFPLLICVTAMLGSLNAEHMSLIEDLKNLIPAAAYESLIEFLGYVSENYSPAMLIAALLVLFTASSAAFRAILTVMADIQDEHRYLGFWKGVFSVFLSLIFLLAIYASCIIIVTGNWFVEVVSGYIGWEMPGGLWQWIRFVLLFAILFTIIYGVYRLTAPKERPREARMYGAAAASLALVAVSVFFSWTISMSSRYSLIYGSLASVIVLMIWLFICGNILIMGNALNVVLNRWLKVRRYIKQRNKREN